MQDEADEDMIKFVEEAEKGGGDNEPDLDGGSL